MIGKKQNPVSFLQAGPLAFCKRDGVKNGNSRTHFASGYKRFFDFPRVLFARHFIYTMPRPLFIVGQMGAWVEQPWAAVVAAAAVGGMAG